MKKYFESNPERIKDGLNKSELKSLTTLLKQSIEARKKLRELYDEPGLGITIEEIAVNEGHAARIETEEEFFLDANARKEAAPQAPQQKTTARKAPKVPKTNPSGNPFALLATLNK